MLSQLGKPDRLNVTTRKDRRVLRIGLRCQRAYDTTIPSVFEWCFEAVP